MQLLLELLKDFRKVTDFEAMVELVRRCPYFLRIWSILLDFLLEFDDLTIYFLESLTKLIAQIDCSLVFLLDKLL